MALVESAVGGGEAFAAAERLVVMAESEIEDTYRVVTLSRAGERTECRSAEPIAPGKHTLSYGFTRTGEHRGTGELRIDDAVVGEAVIDATLALVIAFEGLDVGRDALVSVCDAYESPFDWTGTLHRVVFTPVSYTHLPLPTSDLV